MNYPLLNLFWTIMWVFLWVLWFMLLVHVVGDVFRDRTLSGWAKAGWLAFVIIIPYLGVLVYLIARGSGIAERDAERIQQNEDVYRSYLSSTDGTRSSTDELTKLADLKEHGHITDEEFQRAKVKVLN